MSIQVNDNTFHDYLEECRWESNLPPLQLGWDNDRTRRYIANRSWEVCKILQFPKKKN